MASATAADVQMFKEMFVFRLYDYAIQEFDWERRVRRDWRKIPTEQHPPITDAELFAHLNQRESIAAYAAKRERKKNGKTQRFSTTRHLLIDLDLGNGQEDVLVRAATVRRALGAPTFALSSPSGGVHLIYLFADEIPVFDLRGPKGTGAAIDLLRHHGLPESRGVMEVFPAARSYLAQENVCRLPFGPGAYLLDPDSLNIEDARMFGARALRHVYEQIVSGELEYVDVKAWRARALKLPIIRDSRTSGGRANARATAEPFLEHGIRAEGERRRAVRALAYHWWEAGKSEEEAVTLTTEWLLTRHNDRSRDWNAARNKAPLLNESEDVVRAIFSRRRAYLATRGDYLPLLTLREVEPLIKLAQRVAARAKAGRPVKITSRSKEVRIDPVKLVDFGVHILQCFVAKLQQIALLAHEHADGQLDDAYWRIISRCQPDFEHQTFRLPLPHRAMIAPGPSPASDHDETVRRKRVVGKDSVAAYKKFLFSRLRKLFRLESKQYAQGRKCCYYWVRIDLSGERMVATGADAWLLTGKVHELATVVSPYVWKTKLLPTVRAFEQGFVYRPRPHLPALELVRKRSAKAVEVARQLARIYDGSFMPPVAPDWRGDQPERHLNELSASVRDGVQILSVTLSYTEPILVAPFIRQRHLDGLLHGTRDVLEDALQECFPNSLVRVRFPGQKDSAIRIKVAFAEGGAVTAVTRGVKRAIRRANHAAIREAIWRGRLHLHPACYN